VGVDLLDKVRRSVLNFQGELLKEVRENGSVFAVFRLRRGRDRRLKGGARFRVEIIAALLEGLEEIAKFGVGVE
jgi:hypothetical protein